MDKKTYVSPVLVELGEAVELTLGYRPAPVEDGNEFYNPCCGGGDPNPDPLPK